MSDDKPTLAKKGMGAPDLAQLAIAEVVVLAPMATPLSYVVPNDMSLSRGDLVRVPLAHHSVYGVVLSLKTYSADDQDRRLKPILQKLDEPRILGSSLDFWLWAAHWTLTPPGVFLQGCLRALKSPKPQVKYGFMATGKPPKTLTKARMRVLENAVIAMSASQLAQSAGVSTAVIMGLEKDGALERIILDGRDSFPIPQPDFIKNQLNPLQSAADQLLKSALSKNSFTPVLLDGVTGSGKTEVYFETIAQVLRENTQAQILILLPEIALTTAVLARFKARFGAEPVQWHSGLTASNRRRIWEGVARGEIRLVVGARSALFLPFERLSLIVVDEEHDGSYKQDEGVRYQARDLAVRRAQMDQCMIILASATPSLESLSHAQNGRYEWVRLDQRHGVAVLPHIALIDMKADAPDKGRWLSAPLVHAMIETLGRGEQVLLFLNRRGYAPLVICKACGERMTSPKSDSWLVEHRASGRLVCHLTGFSMKKPARCPHCDALDSLTSIGPGVERILEEVMERFPNARSEVFSSDTAPDAISSAALIKRVEDGKIDILIATQAAAKGHNFLNLTLVGIVDADLGLKGGDLRAAERTYQLLAQATGRAGRAEKSGRALLQTYAPEHPAMQALLRQDREAFYAYEMMGRDMAKFPPYGRLAALILSAKDQSTLNTFTRQLALSIPNTDGIEVYGPADAPLSLVRGQWRKRFLIRADRNRDLQGFVTHWLKSLKKPNAIRLIIDIDPYSFM